MPGVRVAALTAGTNAALMAEHCKKYRPDLAVMATEAAANELRQMLAGENVRILSGMDGLIAAAELDGVALEPMTWKAVN